MVSGHSVMSGQDMIFFRLLKTLKGESGLKRTSLLNKLTLSIVLSSAKPIKWLRKSLIFLKKQIKPHTDELSEHDIDRADFYPANQLFLMMTIVSTFIDRVHGGDMDLAQKKITMESKRLNGIVSVEVYKLGGWGVNDLNGRYGPFIAQISPHPD